jgi:integrase
MRLNKTSVDRANYGGKNGGRFVLWDDSLPGFGLRVYPTGRKSYVWSYRVKGRKHLMTIGPHGALTLHQARDMVRRLIGQMLEGHDPLVEKQKEALGETILDLCLAFMERHSIPHKKSWREDERRIKAYILPSWASLKIKSVTRSDVAALHHKIGKRSKYEANHVVCLLSKMFSMAMTWGFLNDVAVNVARGIKKYAVNRRDRWVAPEELPKLALAIEAEPNPYVRATIWLYLLTGLRKEELLSMRWDQIDLVRRELRLGDTKSGKPHYLPLSTTAIGVLQNIPATEGNPYVLPGHKTGQHLINVSKPWLPIRKRAGVEDVWLHDLRRTVGSWLAQSGNSLHLIARVLNHSSVETTKIYARFAQDHVREALEKHGKAIMEAANSKPTSVILDLPLHPAANHG